MIWLAALLNAYSLPATDEGIVWAWKSAGGTTYHVRTGDMKKETGSWGVEYTFWLRGDHSADRDVTYRSSLWRLTMRCNGYYTVTAYSKYGPDGRIVETQDGSAPPRAVRPGEMYESLQDTICKDD